MSAVYVGSLVALSSSGLRVVTFCRVLSILVFAERFAEYSSVIGQFAEYYLEGNYVNVHAGRGARFGVVFGGKLGDGYGRQ